MRYQWRINQFLNALVHLSLSLSMEGDYLELSQFSYNSHPFSYNSHQSPLGTSGFLTLMWVWPNLIIPYKYIFYIGNGSLDVGTGASHWTLASSGVSQDTPGMPKYNMTMAVLRLLFMRTVLSCVEFLNDGLASLGRLRLAIGMVGKAWYCSLFDLDLGPGEDGPLTVCRTTPFFQK